eukprot:15355905-Ditylum_brightwellii.AAC.1
MTNCVFIGVYTSYTNCRGNPCPILSDANLKNRNKNMREATASEKDKERSGDSNRRETKKRLKKQEEQGRDDFRGGCRRCCGTRQI